MGYGFIIDHRRCIGCHACTTACKSENEVALGVFRTWVKYVEKGEFPDTRRYFTVLRCNHCDHPPCVQICPTRALFKRTNGIVDFDNSRCIGCRSCMAACPYDAIYIDPETGTAAKCHYCAHRVEIGLQPACVVVCPEQAIIAGDLEEPGQRIYTLRQREQLWIRSPEKGTEPRLFYIDADRSSLTPGEAVRSTSYIWAQVPQGDNDRDAPPFNSSVPREVYSIGHERAWGGMVSAYLWTKSIAAGALLIAGLAAVTNFMGLYRLRSITGLAGPAIGLVFLTLTGLVLLADLGHRERFYYIITHPNRRSWLVWGTWILILSGLPCLIWLGSVAYGKPPPLRGWWWASILIAMLLAGYSAFLLAQARARSWWQSPALLPGLLLHALTAGAAAHWIVAVLAGFPVSVLDPLLKVAVLGAAAVFLACLLEVLMPHANRETSAVARMILRGSFARRFWVGGGFCGVVLPMALVLAARFAESYATELWAGVAAAALVLAGLLALEDVWVQAGQAPPLS